MQTPNNTSRSPEPMIGGFRTISISREGLASLMVEDCLAAREEPESWTPKLVFSSNGQGIALAGQDEKFAAAMNEADIIHADGMPVVLASRRTAAPLPERIATTDFFHDASRAAEEHGLKYYILGSTDEQNLAAVTEMQRLYPKLQIVGRHHGYFDDDESVCADIRASGADVVWVALGKPRQEHWAVRNRDLLKGVGWIKTCGGLYAFLAGDVRRAPDWAQRVGLEWFFRTLDDPKRLAMRYLTTNPYAAYRLWRHTERTSRANRRAS